MRAWRYYNGKGGLETQLQYEEVDPPAEPKPSADQVLVEILSTSVNPADYKLPEVWPRLSRILFSRPITPGLDFAARIVRQHEPVNSKAENLNHGQLVFGLMGRPAKYGPWAEYALVPKNAIAAIPAGVNINDAATAGVAAITAYQTIIPHVKPGDRVFINGGSGGVGVYTIQIAKLMGCHVTVSCSSANAELCRSLGADATIDYRTRDVVKELSTKGKVLDLVIDCVGHDSRFHDKAETFLKPEGLFILIAATDDSLKGVLSMFRSWLLPSFLGGPKPRWKYILASPDVVAMEKIGEWLKDRKLKAVIDEVFEFENATDAIRKSKTGRARGKIIIQVKKE